MCPSLFEVGILCIGEESFAKISYLHRVIVSGRRDTILLVQQAGLRRQAAEGGGDGVELDLLDSGHGRGVRCVLMDHVIRPEKAQREVLRLVKIRISAIVPVVIRLACT